MSEVRCYGSLARNSQPHQIFAGIEWQRSDRRGNYCLLLSLTPQGPNSPIRFFIIPVERPRPWPGLNQSLESRHSETEGIKELKHFVLLVMQNKMFSAG